jgi:hypothetical protein
MRNKSHDDELDLAVYYEGKTPGSAGEAVAV